jgi:pimeloyl-ACP methyl ester carboxylesterase
MAPYRLVLSRMLALLFLIALVPAAHAQPPSKRPDVPLSGTMPKTNLQVGSLDLQPCEQVPAYCGSLVRPLDPAGIVAGTITIKFEYYPRQDTSQSALGTIVAVEGGPGFGSTGSRGSYLSLYRPLLDRRNLLLVDNRGTGQSGAISCNPLQKQGEPTQQAIALCGATLGNTSDLYGSGIAADDLAAVLDALATGPVDLYGDSYGTFFSQTFSARHPDKLRSVVLDAAYPVVGLSPWYPFNASTVRYGFNIVCKRSVTCPTGNSIERIERFLNVIRQTPISGLAADGNGKQKYVTVNPGSLAYVMFASGYGPAAYRELDAAVRAYLETDDAAPILRIIAENETASRVSTPLTAPSNYSQGLFLTSSCSDNPQIYDMTSPPAQRVVQRDLAVARKQIVNPEIYAPFTIEEFQLVPLGYSYLNLCITWPVASVAHPPGQPIPPGATFTTAPTLVLSGELDSVTNPVGGAVAAASFPNSTQVLVANSFHVTAIADQDDCASKIVVNFVSTLSPGNTTCASQIAEVRVTPRFAKKVVQVPPAIAATGNEGTAQDLKASATAALTVGDMLTRWWVNFDRSGVGLRGGEFRYRTPASQIYQFQLDNLQWVEDEAVSGTAVWNYNTGAVVAKVRFSGQGTEAGELTIQWNDRQPKAIATLSGKIGDRLIQATMSAP